MNKFLQGLMYAVRPLSVAASVVFFLFVILVAAQAKEEEEAKQKQKEKDKSVNEKLDQDISNK